MVWLAWTLGLLQGIIFYIFLNVGDKTFWMLNLWINKSWYFILLFILMYRCTNMSSLPLHIIKRASVCIFGCTACSTLVVLRNVFWLTKTPNIRMISRYSSQVWFMLGVHVEVMYYWSWFTTSTWDSFRASSCLPLTASFPVHSADYDSGPTPSL